MGAPGKDFFPIEGQKQPLCVIVSFVVVGSLVSLIVGGGGVVSLGNVDGFIEGDHGGGVISMSAASASSDAIDPFGALVFASGRGPDS